VAFVGITAASIKIRALNYKNKKSKSMKNFIARGKVLTVIAAAAMLAGDLVKIGGGLIGVAANSAYTGEETEVSLTGVFAVAKAAIAISQGDKLYADEDGVLSKTAEGNTFAGYAYADAAAGDATVELLLANGI
jgi:predicted RecA/RadA family phage recombinase